MPCKYANIIVTPSELEFEVTEGWKFIPPYQYLRIAKDGPGMPPHWSISLTQDWLSVMPHAGEVPRKVRVGCDSPGMGEGTYHGHITVTSTMEITNPVIDVTLRINPRLEPPPKPMHRPGPAELPGSELEEMPPEYKCPPNSARSEVEPAGDTTYYPPIHKSESTPEPESWFMTLIRWILELFPRS